MNFRTIGDRDWAIRLARPGDVEAVIEVVEQDCYQLAVVREWLPRRAMVWDIGAHIGSFAVAACESLRPSRVVAIEPNEDSRRLLRVNTRSFGDQVEIVPRAIAHSGDTVVLTDYIHSTTGNKTLASEVQDPTFPPMRRVSAVTVEALIREHGNPDLVKMDCEGAEHDILPRLAEHAPCVIIGEWHSRPSREFRSDLERLFGADQIARFDVAPENDTMGLFTIRRKE